MALPKITFWCRYARYRSYIGGENSKPVQFEGNLFVTDDQAQIDFLRKDTALFKEMKQESTPSKRSDKQQDDK